MPHSSIHLIEYTQYMLSHTQNKNSKSFSITNENKAKEDKKNRIDQKFKM